jgi:integrase
MSVFNSIFGSEFENYLTVRKTALSDSAYKHEICYLTSFDAFLAGIGLQKKEISEPIFNEWQKTLTGKMSSIANKIIVIRLFIKYLHTLGIQAHTPVIPKTPDDYIPYIFSDEELDRIFNEADNIIVTNVQPNPLIKTAFPMILRMLYGCGLRIGETLALKMKDIDLDGGLLTLLHTKNEKHRLVPMRSSLTEILRQYCLAMGLCGNPDALLFPSANLSVPMSVKSVQNKLDVILKNLGMKASTGNRYERARGPCQHCMRHVFVFKSFAQAQRNGRGIDDSVPFLSIYLGHDSLTRAAPTTQSIVHVSAAQPRIQDSGFRIQNALCVSHKQFTDFLNKAACFLNIGIFQVPDEDQVIPTLFYRCLCDVIESCFVRCSASSKTFRDIRRY